MTLDSNGFDIWSKDYDKTINKYIKGYPFEGYYSVLDYIYDNITTKGKAKILDIGVGTGLLTCQLYNEGSNIYGIDFSDSMLEIAKSRMPYAMFKKWDFNYGLPAEFLNETFDYIISSYAIHHIDNSNKVNFLRELRSLLNDKGKILIGDIAFKTMDDLLKCQELNKSNWDYDESYIIADDLVKDLRELNMHVNHFQLSSCAGVLVIL